MVDKVRMAFIGIGWWSGYLADAAKRSNRIEIVACHSKSETKMRTFSQKYGGLAHRNYGDLVTDGRIDAVVLTTPNSLHAPQAIEAMKNGKHVFVEKPMALSVADCRQMMAVAKEARVILAVGHKDRRFASMRKAKGLLDKGFAGQVILIESSHSNDYGMKLTPEMWQWSQKETPGGPLCSLTVHHADTFRHFVGPVKKVTALISKVCGRAETDDAVSAAVQFDNGALGYMGGTYLTPIRKCMQINGTEGIIFIDQEGGSVYYQKKGTRTLAKHDGLPDNETQRKDACFEEIDEFASCIRDGGRPETGGEEGLAAWAVMEAIIKSAASGLPVKIKDLID